MAQLSVLTPDLVNRRYPDVEFLITKEWVEKFFKSLGHAGPVEAIAPHSFFSCLRSGEFFIFADLGIDLQQLLHVSQTFSYYSHLKVGDKVTTNSHILKLTPRKLGGEQVVYLELATKYFREGELIADAGGSVIVRELR